MAKDAGLQKRAASILAKFDWDVEYFKGLILGLVWLDIFEVHNQLSNLLDTDDVQLSEEDVEHLSAYANKLCDDILDESYRFSAGCKVNEKSLTANYKKENRLFQWATGVFTACHMREMMADNEDDEVDPSTIYILDRIAEAVFPFADQKFAVGYFEEINEEPLSAKECAYCLARLRTDLPKIIRDITLSSQMLGGVPPMGEEFTLEDEFAPAVMKGPVQNVHSFFAGVTNPDNIAEIIDELLPRVMNGKRSDKVKHTEILMQYAEKALGEDFIQENAGVFWGLIETRPFMRVLMALAEAYRTTMHREKAAVCYERALYLCHDDNLGARYILSALYIELCEVDKALGLFERYEEESPFMLYNHALALFIATDGARSAEKALKDAVECNPYVITTLLNGSNSTEELPGYYEPGSQDEANIYVADSRLLWRNTPGALDWLAGQAS